MNRKILFAAISFAGLICTIASSEAVIISSTDFSFGYGANINNVANAWQLQAVSSSSASGDFTFSPTVSGASNSSRGPLFTNRVLTNSPTDQVNYTGSTLSFNVEVAAAYSGIIPLDATNVQITLEITSISIYGLRFSSTTPSPVNSIYLSFAETTVGHASASDGQLMKNVFGSQTPLYTASNYTQLVWNPDEFSENGTSTTRTFSLAANSDLNQVLVDGFEVFGRVQISYDVIPEPTSVGMIVFAGLFVAGVRRRYLN